MKPGALHSVFWQNPFVDVFKTWPHTQKGNSDKQGEVSEIHDKTLGKKVMKISGTVSGSNWITIPSKKNNSPTLGLVGRYIYFECMAPAGSLFSFHFEYFCMGKTIKLSFSNLYKSVKVISETTIQIPFKENLNRWAIILIDAKAMIRELLIFSQEGKKEKYIMNIPDEKHLDIELESIQICSKLFVRGIYTSDNLYNVKTLPREIAFRLAKGEEFEKSYSWIIKDSCLNPDILPAPDTKENNNTQAVEQPLEVSVQQAEKPEKPERPHEMGSTLSEGFNSKTDGFDGKPMKPSLKTTNRPSSVAHAKNKPLQVRFDETGDMSRSKSVERSMMQQRDSHESADPEHSREHPHRTIKLKSQHFTLEPNPIMALSHFQGFQSKDRNMTFADDTKIIYSCGNTMCLMDVKTRYQKFFIGQVQSIRCLAANLKKNALASVDDSDKECKIYLWSIFPQKLETSFNAGLKSINSCDIATRRDNNKHTLFLTVSGKDHLNRTVIAMYDITDFAFKEPYLFCKQISDFDIKCIKFISKNDANYMVSCGKENIRFWRLKHKLITGTSLILGEHARGNFFNDFVVFNYDEHTATEESNYKIVFCSDQGNVYLVDYKEQELQGIFKLHEGPITVINVNPANHYFISAGQDKYVRIWNMDVTQMLFEVKVDSQVNHILINGQDQVYHYLRKITEQIFCGCQNGTIGELKLEEKRMDYLVRSHNDSIIMMDYHPLTKKLVSISHDLTIKIWDVRNGGMIQFFEFRCIDEQVSFLRCFTKREVFICGFESGSLRVFDIQKCVVLGELEGHKAQVVDIQISPDDKFIATTDISGKIQVFDQNLNFIKELNNDSKYQSQFVTFDLYNQYLLTKYNPNTIKIYKIGTWTPKYSLTIEEEILKASFSSTKGDLFLLTSKARLKKCRLSDTVTVEREYWSLHNGNIYDFIISKNCRFIFTIGEDNLLKCWDYFFRGKLTPAFQAYSIGTSLRKVTLSNDETNMVFTYGIENNGIFCFEFKSDMVSHLEEDFVEEPEPEPFMSTIGRSSTADLPHVFSTGTRENFRQAFQTTDEVKSIYHEAELATGQQTSTIHMKEQAPVEKPSQKVNEPVKEIVKEPVREVKKKVTHKEEQKEDPGFKLGKREAAMAKEVAEESFAKQKGRNLYEAAVNEVTEKYKIQAHQEMEKYFFNEDNLEGPIEAMVGPEGEYVPTYKLPGQFMDLKSIIGCSFNDGAANLVWNTTDNYFAHSFGPSVVVTFMEDPKSQKYLNEQHSDDIAHLKLSKHHRYMISATKEAKNEGSCSITIWDAAKLCYLRSVTHNQLQKIHCIDITPCENYFLVLGESAYDPYALLFLWEIQSGSLVTNTLYQTKSARVIKWNNAIKGALEFTMLTDDNIIMWRLNLRRNLEYQEANFDRVVLKGHKYTAVDYLESKLFQDTAFMFVGTSQGTLMVFDTRSNTLCFQCNSFIKGPIGLIFAFEKRLTLTGADANVFSWKLDKLSDPQDLVQFLQETPDILLVDSKPCAGEFLWEEKGEQGILGTKGGIAWYLDWNERATLKLVSSHISGQAVTAIKAHYVDQDETLVISAGLDGTVRLWNANTIDQILEFHVPRREALSIDIHRDTFKCVCGFSDGNVRFFDYGRNINYGGVQLYTEPETKDKNEKNKVYPVSAVCFLGHENTILAGNMNGEVYMIYVQSWENMRVEVRLLVQNAGFAINHLAVSEVEPWDTWLLGTKNRKVMVWNRKDLNFNAKKDIEYYKRLFTKINELEYYLIDNYKIHQKGEKEGNFDDLKQEIDPHNKYEFQGDTIAHFARRPDLCVAMTNQIQEIFFRDYKAHLVFKSVRIDGFPRSIFLREKQSELIVGSKDGVVRFIEWETGIERDKVNLSKDGVKNLEVCLPKQTLSLETMMLEPRGDDFRLLACSSKNGIFLSRLQL